MAAAGATQTTSGRPRAARASRHGGGAGALRLGGGKEDDERTHGRCRRAGGIGRAQARRRRRQPAADDLDTEGTGDAVELLDAHEGADGAPVGEAAGGDPLGEGLEQVDALGGELGLDRLGDRVVGDDLVDVVVLGRGVVRDLEHDVEADALVDAVFAAEGADLDAAGIVADGDAVERRSDVARRSPRVRQLERDGGFVHVAPPHDPVSGNSAAGAKVQAKAEAAAGGERRVYRPLTGRRCGRLRRCRP